MNHSTEFRRPLARGRRPVLAALLLLGLVLAPAPAAAQEVTFGEPTAQATLGSPITFSTTLESDTQPAAVELLLRTPGSEAVTVLPAQLTALGDAWQATRVFDGHVPPNTRFEYQFRARDAAGTHSLGSKADAVVTDARFEWQTLEGNVVRLHWYAGDEGFAGRALEIGEEAVANAAQLLGVRESEPIDFFIYDSEAALREALGPGTRENVGGQAHADIRTLFGLIEPSEINSNWVDTLVAHELTHLVFDTATDNPYHAPPRWLNEGVAVYLSEGYSASWRAAMEEAVGRRAVIPLDGLGGLFPTTALEFRLAYAESVSAVDFFIRTYDEPTLWDLVRSYAEGVSDDEAFTAATGADLDDFNAAWMESLGLPVPEPHGPQPGPPGPLPPGWDTTEGRPAPSLAPGGTPDPAVPQPPATSRPDAPPAPDRNADGGLEGEGLLVALAIGGLVVVAVIGLGLLARRRLLT